MFFNNIHKALFVGAHTDDEMVVAGTLRKLVKAGVQVKMFFLSYAPVPGMSQEDSTRIVHPEFLGSMRAMGVRDGDFEVAGLEPRTMPGQQDKIRQLVFDLTEREKPDIAFILSSEDDHQDHATLGKACQVVMKNRVPNIIRCHNPWNFINPGRANLFVRLSPDEFEAKLAVIRSYTSQLFRYDYEGLFTAITQANGLATKNRLAEAFEIAYLIAGEE